jgi:prepilin-type N-terminal cleavage/methylation domain-containing protein
MTPVMDTRSPRHARSDRGFALIEVIVSAAVLAIVALSVLAGIDGAQRSTGREKARSVAAAVAEQEQEQLRSQQFDTLVGYAAVTPPVHDVPVGNITYTVKNEVFWQVDSASGQNQCTSSSSDASYLRVTSTVTSSIVGTNVQPVKVSSLVAPSIQYSASHGSLGIKIVDRNNAGVGGIVVTTGGKAAYSGTTNSDGCVLFSNIPIGTYTASVNTGGYVDTSGTQAVVLQDQEVVSGSVTVGSITYDRAATVAATVQSYPPNATNSTTFFTSKAPAVSGVNGTKVGLIRTTPTPVTASTYSLISSPALFPFTTKYAFFTGQCEYSNPATYDTTSPAFSYWASSPTPPGQIQVLPGQNSMPVSVRQPPLLVNIKRKSGTSGASTITAAGQVKVVAIPQIQNGDDCAEAPVYDLTNVSWTSGDGAPTANTPVTLGWVGRINPINIGGKLIPDAGVPFGKYKFCLEDTTVTPHKKTVWPDTVDATKQPYDATKPYPGTTGTSSNINNPLTISATSTMWSTGTC